MKNADETPLYATLLYEVRKGLNITIAEYFYIDMVYHLSKNDKGWCYKSLDSIAYDMGITKNGVVKLRDRMIERGFIKKSKFGHVKTTDMYNSVVRGGKKPYNSVTNRTTQYNAGVQLSGTKNNNRRTENTGMRYKTASELGMPDLGI